MAGLTLDTGALIAADRNDRKFWAYFAEAIDRGVVPVIPAVALAQGWRSPHQARLAQLVNSCFIESFDEVRAKRSGELCARAKVADVVDAAVVESASRRGDAVLTSDPKDLRHVSEVAVGNVKVIKL